MNKYSEWIFWYLLKGSKWHSNKGRYSESNLGSMCRDFSLHFYLANDWWITNRLLRCEDKLCFFWLLAHVDQETADAMLML